MLIALAWVEILTFAALSLIHLNWGFGGEWGFEKSLPTNEEGDKVLNPKKRDSLIVGIGLLFFLVFYLIKARIILFELPFWVTGYAGWLISSIFILRAIGDFKYIGFFKRIKETDFGIRDTNLYSPLCLFLGLNGFFLELNF